MKKLIALLLCLALLISLAGCGNTPDSTEPPETTVPPTTTEPAPTPAELYAGVADAMRQKQDLLLDVTYIREMTLGVDTFKETIQQDVTLRDLGTEGFTASLVGTYYNGSFSSTNSEIYTGGKMYTKINADGYSAEMSGEDYLARLVPVVMLSADLYDNVELSGQEYTFSGATALESWVDTPYATLISAEGTAEVDDAGLITRSTYKAQFAHGPAEVSISVTVKITENPGDPFSVPAAADTYALLDTPEGPELINTIRGYLLQAESIQTSQVAISTVEAANYMDIYALDVSTWGSSATQSVKFTHNVQMYDTGSGEVLDEYVMEETFRNGILTTVIDGGEPEEQAGFLPSYIRDYADDLICAPFPLMSLVEDYDLTILGDVAILDFTLTNDAAEDIIDVVLDEILLDPDAYRAEASGYTTKTATGSITLDAVTLMPIAMSQEITGLHTLDGIKYATSVSVQQTFLLSGEGTYETITGEPLPQEEPEEKAQPLFYHVTGAEGQEMWLLGTIHVGDNRTEYLPQEIYDAFDAADALAVEFDSDVFMEQSQSDPELMEQIRNAYLYSDGTLLDAHLEDEQLHDDTIKLLKATGMYQQTMVLYKPYFIAQLLDNFFMDYGYALSSDYGVDFLLEDRAREQEKEIRSVETGISQVLMLANFSDALQEQLLAETVYYGHVRSNMASAELFEMWCEGDEDALRAYINDEDSEEMTEEEKALLEEYNKAISSDRNVQMTQVAIDYLESGDTVFYAVGLAHLLADADGLVDALRAAGYTVELVKYA